MHAMRKTAGILAALLAIVSTASLPAAPRTWVGSGNWSIGGNWSGGLVPGPDDDVIFDATSTNNAVIDAFFGGSVTSVTITAGYTGIITQNRDLQVGGNFTIDGGLWRYSAGTAAELIVDGDLTIGATIQCQRSSTTGHGVGRVFTIGGDLTVGAAGVFDGRGLGFNANQGPGIRIGGQGAAGHGGMGGTWNNPAANGGGGTTYGSVTNPSSLGSGGSSGTGGGAIIVQVGGTATIDGLLDADGALITTTGSGTGAGGTLFLRAAAIAGSGTMRARGGYWASAPEPPSGSSPYSSGAGGRIALYADTVSFPIANLDASARWSGTHGRAGGAGTIYLQTDADPQGTLIVDGKDTVTSAGAWAKPTTLFGPLVTDVPSGNVWIRSLGDLQLPVDVTLAVGGYWTNSAYFTADNNSTVVFDTPQPAAISGSSIFYDLICTNAAKTLTVTAGHTLTVRNLLTLQGAAGNALTLRSTAASSWYLTVQNAALPHAVRHVDVAWSHAGGGAVIPAYESVDSGNNVNWVFAEEDQTNTWTGAVNTDWANAGNWSLGRATVPADVVVIAATANQPTLDYDKAVAHLTIETGALLRLANRNLLVTGNLAVQGTLIAAGTERIDLWGDANLTGGLFQNAVSTVRLTGTTAQRITSGAQAAFNRIELINTGGSLTFTDRARTTNIVVFGSTATFAGGLTCAQAITNHAGPLTFGGPVSAAELTTSNAPLHFQDTVMVDTFRNTTADLTFGAAVTCGELRSDGANTLTFAPGAMVTVSNLWLNGRDDAPLILRSSVPGTPWGLTVTRAAGVARILVSDSDASGGLTIEPVLSLDDGNNLNWYFAVTADWRHWTGAVSTDFMTAANWDPAEIPGPASRLFIDGYYMNAPRLQAAVTVARLTLGGHRNVILTLDAPLTVAADLRIWPRGIATHSANAATPLYAMDVMVQGDLFVAGTIDVTGRGYSARNGPGAATSDQGGGGHGGEGGDWGGRTHAVGKCYGSITAPNQLGSGGNSGPGGGAIRLQVNGHTAVDGLIAADGLDLGGSAAGAGGSVWLTLQTLDGNGTIRADGGRGGTYNTWGYSHGGGGRVAVYLESGQDIGAVELRAISKRGANANHRGGGAGSVYLRKAGESHGVCIYDNQNVLNVWRSAINAAVIDPQVGDFILRGATTIMLLSNQTLTVHGSWSNGALFAATEAGKVRFAGPATGTVYGTTNFDGLACHTPGKTLRFEAGRTFTVNGLLDLRVGRTVVADGPLDPQAVTVRSTVDGLPWNLTLNPATGSQQVRQVIVRDSNAGGGQTIYAQPFSEDRGNNINWIFVPPKGSMLVIR